MPPDIRAWIFPVGAGTLLAYGVCFFLAPALIPLLTRLKFGQTVRDDGPQTHLKKSGTPTMGGLVFFVAVTVGGLLPVWVFGSPLLALAAAGGALACGGIGFADDYIKVVKKRSLGLRARQKLLLQLITAAALAAFGYFVLGGPVWLLPWGGAWDLGLWAIPATIFIIVAVTNALNLIDGLDGLCSSVTAVVMAAMAVLLALYALSPLCADAGQSDALMGLAVFTGAVAGCCMAFLRVNRFPARVFMGDTGAMFLGGAVSCVYCLSGFALLLPLMGFMYLATALSVMLQVAHFKRTKKRLFRMAPLHHHFELKGAGETKIVVGYALATALFCALAFVIVSL